MRRGPKPAKSKEAKPPAARKSPKDDARVPDLEKRLAAALGQLQARDRELLESLEQQTAMAEVLRVIASSPTDLQKALESIARSAAKLTESESANVQQAFGEFLRSVARFGISNQAVAGMNATGAPGP